MRGRLAKLAPGVLVGGRFRVDRAIAKGGMGEVWAGEHCATGMRVALKMLLPETSTNAEVVQRFKREAVLLGRVRSDRVARVIDFIFDPRCGAVLVTEFVEGPSLADVQKSEPMSVEGAVELGIEIARALRDLHRAHIVHRDLKPGNVILQPLEDGSNRAVLVDLGVSRLVSPGAEDSTDALTDITKTQIVLGTIGFMAPEQILGPREVTASADLYGLGAILFRMVRGNNVFGGMSQVDQLRAKLQDEAPRLKTGRTDALARGFEAIVSRALQREPSLRYASADEMIAALSALRDAASGIAMVYPRGSPRARGRHRTTRTVLTAIAAITLTACAAVGVVHRARLAPSSPPSQLATIPAPQAMPASPASDGVEAPAGLPMCAVDDAPGNAARPLPRDLPAAPSLRAGEIGGPQTQRARDAALMRAIRRAVQDEAYMTLALPSHDEIQADWAARWQAPSAALAAAGR